MVTNPVLLMPVLLVHPCEALMHPRIAGLIVLSAQGRQR